MNVITDDAGFEARDTLRTFLIFGCLFFVYMWGLGDAGLCDPDEGRYAEIPRAMAAAGDYITPRLNGLKYFEKPVLTYWLSAASLKLFGESGFAVRFPAALAAFAGIIPVWLLARREYGRRTADLSAVVLGGSLLYYAMGRIILTDMILSACLTATFAAVWFAVRGERRGLSLSLAFAGMGLSLLAKGLIGLVLPGGVIILYAILSRNLGVIWLFARFLPGYVIFAAVTLPWFWAVCAKNPDFFYFFFIHEHFLRYTTTVHDRYEPAWFFIPLVIVGFVPWSGFLYMAFKDAFKAAMEALKEKGALNFELFLLCWFFFILVFFSASDSKLVPYIIPAMAPVAVMTAVSFTAASRIPGRLVSAVLLNSILLLLLAAAFMSLKFFFDDPAYDLKLAYRVGHVIALSMLLLILSFISFLPRFRSSGGTFKILRTLLPFFVMIFLLAVQPAHSVAASKKSVTDLCTELKGKIKPEDVIINYEEFIQGIQFGLHKRILLVDYVGELEFGKNAEPELAAGWFMTKDEFEQYLNTPSEGDKILIIENKNMRNLTPNMITDAIIIGANHNFSALRLR